MGHGLLASKNYMSLSWDLYFDLNAFDWTKLSWDLFEFAATHQHLHDYVMHWP